MRLFIPVFILFLVVSNSLSAQKVKYDGAKLAHLNYPIRPLNGTFKKYKFDIRGVSTKDRAAINNGFKLEAFEKVKDAEDADFLITVTLSEVETSVKVAEAGSRYVATYYVTYSASVEIANADNVIIDTLSIFNLRNEERSTSQAPTESMVYDQVPRNKQAIEDELTTETRLQWREKIRNAIDTYTDNTSFKIGYVKKDSELIEASEAINKELKKVNLIRHEGATVENEAVFTKAIDLWQKRLSSLDQGDSENADLVMMYQHNLAIANFFLGNYESAKELASGVSVLFAAKNTFFQLKEAHIQSFQQLVSDLSERLAKRQRKV